MALALALSAADSAARCAACSCGAHHSLSSLPHCSWHRRSRIALPVALARRCHFRTGYFESSDPLDAVVSSLLHGRCVTLGQVAFPGGHVESGESDLDAVVREVREEVGLSLHDSSKYSLLGEVGTRRRRRPPPRPAPFPQTDVDRVPAPTSTDVAGAGVARTRSSSVQRHTQMQAAG